MGVVRKKVMVEVIDHEETGAVVRFARKRAGLSLQQVATRVALSPQYLSNLETGNRPWSQYLYDTIMTAIVELA